MVHTFQCLGVNIAVDVNSGAVHVLDQLSYDLLNCVTPPMAEHCPEDVIETLSQYPREELEECWQELKELAERARRYIPERVRYYAPRVGVDYGSITIRCQKSRWGSCSTKWTLQHEHLLFQRRLCRKGVAVMSNVKEAIASAIASFSTL